MKDAGELAAQRYVTASFIAADKVSITLHTKVRLITGPDKGILDDGPDRAAQVFRLIPQSLSSSTTSYDGVEVNTGEFVYVLLGAWDCAMEETDWWLEPDTGRRFEIRKLLQDNGYERKGVVIGYDRRPVNG